eukprot:PhM_4_TR13586/c0_g1_i1/m.84290
MTQRNVGLIVFCCCVLIVMTGTTTATPALRSVEQDALVDIFYACDARKWSSPKWLLSTAGSACSTWSGVTCNAEGTAVTSLSINTTSSVRCEIPSSIGAMSSLKTLRLVGRFTPIGEIPASLQNCVELNTIEMTHTQLSGTFPSWLADMVSQQSLTTLIIDNGIPARGLDGPIPDSLIDFINKNTTNFTTPPLIRISNATLEGVADEVPEANTTFVGNRWHLPLSELTLARTPEEFDYDCRHSEHYNILRWMIVLTLMTGGAIGVCWATVHLKTSTGLEDDDDAAGPSDAEMKTATSTRPNQRVREENVVVTTSVPISPKTKTKTKKGHHQMMEEDSYSDREDGQAEAKYKQVGGDGVAAENGTAADVPNESSVADDEPAPRDFRDTARLK